MPKTKGGRHFGSRLLLVPNVENVEQYYLYISLGDRGLRMPAQDISNHIGTLIRVYDDGKIPSDNPFIDQPQAKPGVA